MLIFKIGRANMAFARNTYSTPDQFLKTWNAGSKDEGVPRFAPEYPLSRKAVFDPASFFFYTMEAGQIDNFHEVTDHGSSIVSTCLLRLPGFSTHQSSGSYFGSLEDDGQRNTTSLKPLSGLGSKTVRSNQSLQDDRRMRDRRRSRDRERSRSRRSRERSLERKRRHSQDRSSHKRSFSKEKDDSKNIKHRDRRSPSRDMSKKNRRSRDKSSSERNSDSYSSHDSRVDRKSSKHLQRSRDKDSTEKSRVDTFANKFERRRDSSVEEEVVDNHVVYRDSSASPEPSKHRKKKHCDKEKKKEKRKDKKKKKRSKTLDKCDDSLTSCAVSISSEHFSREDDDRTENDSPSVGDLLRVKEDTPLKDMYGPIIPPKTDSKMIGPVVPSSSPEESLPGNRSSLHESSPPQLEKDVFGPLVPTSFNRKSPSEETAKESSPAKPEPATASLKEGEASGRVYGPVLPQRAPVAETPDDDASYGPALPPRLLKPQPPPVEQEDEEDDGGYGPLPAGLGGRTQEELEIRAALIKRQLGNKVSLDESTSLEAWKSLAKLQHLGSYWWSDQCFIFSYILSQWLCVSLASFPAKLVGQVRHLCWIPPVKTRYGPRDETDVVEFKRKSVQCATWFARVPNLREFPKSMKDVDSRPKKREEWMIELPDARRAEFGLGPRKFRAREAPDMSDRSSWTDTPEEKKRREELSRLGVVTEADEEDNTNSKLLGIIARDKEMEKKAREKKKDKSLLDMHQKELKKKKKKEEKERGGKKEERRPFSREVDLQTNRFDEAQKKSIIKKAQLLDSRFSRGESKYL
ncbi:hypothetical protein GE061_015728 [Apolygus lucorum]|uniref:DUF3752 domain-containing protein n=1 Tax=Apolygus lucorum TaxID=248454 RepID=A0A8S9XM04_APOLU|nr:hypothetical protein GE061_015728 [Apolygus lucorum]